MSVDFTDVIKNGPFLIKFPSVGQLGQDEEWCEVKVDDEWKKIRFHDYNDVYKIPGLYETIFYRTLMCNSPTQVCALLSDVLTELHRTPGDLRVLDLGAGNGMSGEALQNIGTRKIIGVDIIKEAKMAALRDRPWVYDEYKVCDFTNVKKEEDEFFKNYKFNTLMTIAALGFGDIPPMAFYNAYNYVENDGLIVFNIRDQFMRLGTRSPFAQLITKMIEKEIIEIELYKRYRHRLTVTGDPIYYVAIIARKKANFKSLDDMLTES
jgi:SAM-dependent methyltransferase